MTTLYLVRHGETTENAAHIIQGTRNGHLAPLGISQMDTLTFILSNVRFDAIVSSDLKRAYDSAQVLANYWHLPINISTLLRERDWGDFTGRYIPDLKGLPMPDNVEKMEALLQRAKSFLDWVKATYPNETVIAVGHGIINKAIQAVHYGKQTRDIPKMSNAEYRILRL